MKNIIKISYIYVMLSIQVCISASESIPNKTTSILSVQHDKIENQTKPKKNHIPQKIYKISKKRSCNIIQSAEEYKKIYMNKFHKKDFDALQKQDVLDEKIDMQGLYDFDEIFNPELIQKYEETQDPL